MYSDLPFKRVLLTGAAGFIGSHCAAALASQGLDVLGLDNLNDYYDVKLKKDRLQALLNRDNIRFELCDITDKHTTDKLFSEFKPQAVLHLAAQAGVRYSLENPFSYEYTNGLGFLNVIDAARRSEVAHFVYASSSSVYGNSPELPYREDRTPEHPVSFYAATKRYNEHVAAVFSDNHGLPCTGLRFFTVYGPWGRPDMAYYSFSLKILQGLPLTVYDGGSLKRDYTYIDDIVQGVLAALGRPASCSIYNLGGHHPHSVTELVELLQGYLGRKAVIRREPRPAGDVKSTYADIDKARQELGFDPGTDFGSGLRKFTEWFTEYHRS